KRRQSKLRWKEVTEAEGDALLAPRRIAFELPDSLSIDLREFAVRPSRLQRYRTKISDSYQLGFVFGAFLGDGHAFLTTNGRSEIGNIHGTFGRDEIDTVLKFEQCLYEVTGVPARVSRVRNTIRVYLFSLQWARLLAEFGKREEKHLPTRYLCGN